MARTISITACVPRRTKSVGASREIQNVYFTKRISFDQFTPEYQRIHRQGGTILNVQCMGS
ncbi:phycobilisome linker polypeptide [Anthocerotibacter panamensis]|uniref:ApcC1 n=1 Tax=Anthocerotibacter panamensis TaxID=2857077 RepID=A0AAJ6N6F4_9CYAN|nr:phycobilisome linker polypeptide [Anthocerotibacter panamensis]8IMK_M Chain M, ApcC1 [Anthocerotibacter panamensis]8IMK_Z Chain Z, ApcC1 [Anthocerotibacter panamensis]8IMK_m Chain m, ApcC1 [Anthocerotibacter panamensis]8IMK_z Chain z, ApcC1 [Anthocerotibacter panamensis]